MGNSEKATTHVETLVSGINRILPDISAKHGLSMREMLTSTQEHMSWSWWKSGGGDGLEVELRMMRHAATPSLRASWTYEDAGFKRQNSVHGITGDLDKIQQLIESVLPTTESNA